MNKKAISKIQSGKLAIAALMVGVAVLLPLQASKAWWNDNDRDRYWRGDRWYGNGPYGGGPYGWGGGYPGYGWGGGYPGYGWGGGYPGYGAYGSPWGRSQSTTPMPSPE